MYKCATSLAFLFIVTARNLAAFFRRYYCDKYGLLYWHHAVVAICYNHVAHSLNVIHMQPPILALPRRMPWTDL